LDTSAVGVLRAPRVTEKASMAAAKNEYVFEVYPKASKIQVKRAVEKTYNVNVVSVNTVNLPSKVKRIGRRLGKTAAIRKAIVRLQKGQTIDILPR
ncbi:MAG: 50S ribosomal protein L23, partial [bacterium]|nr:50S ribosomal protein L23 [bacterium]